MSTNWIFKLENVHIITRRKQSILSIQHEIVNIMSILCCSKNEELITDCLLVHKIRLFHGEFTYPHSLWTFQQSNHNLCIVIPTKSTFLDINVRKLGFLISVQCPAILTSKCDWGQNLPLCLRNKPQSPKFDCITIPSLPRDGPCYLYILQTLSQSCSCSQLSLTRPRAVEMQ